MVRVHIISSVFPPEPMMSAVTGRDIAEEMTKRGHQVTVIASFPNRPSGKLYPNYRRSWKKAEQRDGYELIHCWHTLSKNSGLLSRLAENISFGVTSTLQLTRAPRPDVVYMNTWPLLAEWISTLALARRDIPVICSVKDLYPESLLGNEVQGTVTKMAASIARTIDKQTFRRSAVVAPLNPIMAEHIVATRSIPAEKVRVVYDWVDASQVPVDQPKWNGFRKQHGFSAELFLAMYVGSMTRMAGLKLYVEAAELLRHRQDIRILLVGDGSMRQEIESLIQQKELANIRVIYPLEPGDVPEVQSAADVLMLSLLPGGAEHALPSKLISYLFSQRPVVASVNSDGPPGRIIRDGGCGSITRQGNAQDLADQLERMADDRPSLTELGENARRFAEEHFSKDNALRRACNLIEEVGNR
jgi:glycosyltransferase involved in cell wall biosynthesis